MDKTLKSLPRDITIGQLLRVLKYALSRHWTKLEVGEFNKLMSMIPKKSAPGLFKAMGMSLDIDAVSGLLNKFDDDTKLQTLLNLAKKVQKMNFKTITIKQLNAFINSVPKKIITSMLGDMSSMLDLLEKLPGHLRLTRLLNLAGALGETDFHKVTIGEFLDTISSVSPADLDAILASMGMNFELAPVVGLLQTLDQNMRIADAFALAQTATSLDLHTATIKQLSDLLKSVGPTTANGLLKGIATYEQLKAMLGMFPGNMQISQILADAQTLLQTLQGDLTKLHISDVKAIVAKWGPLLVQLGGGKLGGALDMAKKLINMLPETSTIEEALAPFDAMIGSLLNGSFNNAKKMLSALPDMVWDLLKVPKSKVMGILDGLDSDKPLMEMVSTILNTDFANMDIPEIGDVIFTKLGFDDFKLKKLLPVFLIDRLYPGYTERGYYEDSRKLHGNHHHNLKEWLVVVQKLLKAPFDGTWYEIAQYLKKNMPPEMAFAIMNIGGISSKAFEGLLKESKPDKSFGSLTAFQSANYFSAANRNMLPDHNQPLANLFALANRDMPSAELDAWLPDVDYKLAKGPTTSFGTAFNDAFKLGGADVLNKAFGVKFGDKLQRASVDDLDKWCTIGPIADQPLVIDTVNITISATLNSTVSATVNLTMTETTAASPTATLTGPMLNATEDITGTANTTGITTPIATVQSARPMVNATEAISHIASTTGTTNPIVTVQSTSVPMSSVVSTLSSDSMTETTAESTTSSAMATANAITASLTPAVSTKVEPTALPTNHLRQSTTSASAQPKINVASSTEQQTVDVAAKTTTPTAQTITTSTAAAVNTADVEASKLAEEAEAKKLAEKAQAKKLAEEAQAKTLAEEAAKAKKEAEKQEAEKLAKEAEAKKQAEEAEKAQKKAEKEEAEKLAKEAEAKKQAEEAEKAQKEAEKEEAEKLAKEAEAKKQAEKAEKVQKEAEKKEAEKLAKEAEAKKQAEKAEKAQKEAEEKAARKQAVEDEALKQFGF